MSSWGRHPGRDRPRLAGRRGRSGPRSPGGPDVVTSSVPRRGRLPTWNLRGCGHPEDDGVSRLRFPASTVRSWAVSPRPRPPSLPDGQGLVVPSRCYPTEVSPAGTRRTLSCQRTMCPATRPGHPEGTIRIGGFLPFRVQGAAIPPSPEGDGPLAEFLWRAGRPDEEESTTHPRRHHHRGRPHSRRRHGETTGSGRPTRGRRAARPRRSDPPTSLRGRVTRRPRRRRRRP